MVMLVPGLSQTRPCMTVYLDGSHHSPGAERVWVFSSLCQQMRKRSSKEALPSPSQSARSRQSRPRAQANCLPSVWLLWAPRRGTWERPSSPLSAGAGSQTPFRLYILC